MDELVNLPIVKFSSFEGRKLHAHRNVEPRGGGTPRTGVSVDWSHPHGNRPATTLDEIGYAPKGGLGRPVVTVGEIPRDQYRFGGGVNLQHHDG